MKSKTTAIQKFTDRELAQELERRNSKELNKYLHAHTKRKKVELMKGLYVWKCPRCARLTPLYMDDPVLMVEEDECEGCGCEVRFS